MICSDLCPKFKFIFRQKSGGQGAARSSRVWRDALHCFVFVCVYVCACKCACECACACVCACVCVCARVRVRVSVCVLARACVCQWKPSGRQGVSLLGLIVHCRRKTGSRRKRLCNYIMSRWWGQTDPGPINGHRVSGYAHP